ncbi:DUF2199 domain-containing protein [Actinokineospora auranticolor]|uniref:DUF2199 domain-containing protein n=1 Tax=Actinokineospora auranticolor TaxID=155976 RepID=A0A2S6GSV7_9PSEU|nr:DUF2199 domain-containing protein [Actinokineospora auranticolor]PPK68290.1 hypothetical protein CLV40_10513 [Actinokineospora auranticolor]
MTDEPGFFCSSCGVRHDELPLAYSAPAPAFWEPDMEGRPNTGLSDELCVIDGENFFIRARIVLPVVDAEDPFEWGVWVSLSEANFRRATDLWEDPARVDEPAYFGWLSTEVPLYEPTTLNLKTRVHSQPLGVRPLVELEPTDHPLAVEQRDGIPLSRVREIAEQLLHPKG